MVVRVNVSARLRDSSINSVIIGAIEKISEWIGIPIKLTSAVDKNEFSFTIEDSLSIGKYVIITEDNTTPKSINIADRLSTFSVHSSAE